MPRTYPKAMKGRMVDFSDELWEAVKVDADALGMSMGAFIRQAVSEALRPIGGLITDSDNPNDYPIVRSTDPPSPIAIERRTPRVVVPPEGTDLPGKVCSHPKASRRQLSYGTICDACQSIIIR